MSHCSDSGKNGLYHSNQVNHIDGGGVYVNNIEKRHSHAAFVFNFNKLLAPSGGIGDVKLFKRKGLDVSNVVQRGAWDVHCLNVMGSCHRCVSSC
jgi:hypothetical protein